MFRHVVLFRVRDDVTDPELFAAMEQLRAVGSEPGVRSWDVELSLDLRKGRIVVEDGTFESQAAFHEWRQSEAHRRVSERMSVIADWWVADWIRGEEIGTV